MAKMTPAGAARAAERIGGELQLRDRALIHGGPSCEVRVPMRNSFDVPDVLSMNNGYSARPTGSTMRFLARED